MKFIVAGTGPSVHGWTPPEGYTTIGVHDIGKHFTPDHLVVFDNKRKFTSQRYRIIEQTDPHINLWTRDIAVSGAGSDWVQLRDHPKRKPFLASRPRTVKEIVDILQIDTKPVILPHYRSTTYTACSLAYKLDAKWIGLIGMDIAGHYALMRHLEDLNKSFGRLRDALEILDVTLVNLSKESLLTSVPYHDLRLP